MAILFGNGEDGTVTISVDTNLGTANLKKYANLTVNNGKTLSGNTGFTIYVRQLLTLNGTISANMSGNGGGSVFVFSKTVLGSGTISANATATGTPTAPTIEGLTSPSAPTNGAATASSAGGAAGSLGGVFTIDNMASRVRSLMALSQVTRYNMNAGAGSNGGAATGPSGTNVGGAGSGAGGSFLDLGGAGAVGGAAATPSGSGTATGGAGGKGGGAGGFALICTWSFISLTVTANGQNGDNGTNGTATATFSAGGGASGGGGAGGVVVVICPRFSGSVTVNGGSGGTPGTGVNSGNTGGTGGNGTAGRLLMWDIRNL